MLVTKAWRCNLGLVVSVLRVKLVVGHPRPPSVEKRWCTVGVPCRDPPVCHRVQDDSVGANPVRAVGAAPVILSPLANVLVSLSFVMVFRIFKV